MKFGQVVKEDIGHNLGDMVINPSGRPVAPIAGAPETAIGGMQPVKQMTRVAMDLKNTIANTQRHPNQPVDVKELGREIANFILDITPSKNRGEAMNVIVPEVLDAIIDWFIVEHKMSNPLLKQISTNIERRLTQMEKNPSNMRGVGFEE